MTLNFSAKITVDAKEKTKSIFDSINTDNKFYPENPTSTKMKLIYK
jgi:KEOPS complex subunit Pcc1